MSLHQSLPRQSVIGSLENIREWWVIETMYIISTRELIDGGNVWDSEITNIRRYPPCSSRAKQCGGQTRGQRDVNGKDVLQEDKRCSCSNIFQGGHESDKRTWKKRCSRRGKEIVTVFFSCCLEENQLEPTMRDCWRSYFSCPNLVTSFAYFAGLQETSLRTAWSPLLRQLEAKQPGCSGNQPRSLDWEKKTVSDLPDSAWSEGCIDWSSLTTSEPLDLLEIPLDYNKFTNTFSKSGAYIHTCSTLWTWSEDRAQRRSFSSLWHHLFAFPVWAWVLCTFLNKYLAMGFICPSSSGHAALVLFVHKKDGFLHLCINFWELNQIMKKD